MRGRSCSSTKIARALDLVQSLTPDQARKAILFHNKRDPSMPPGRIAVGDELHLGGCFQDNSPHEGVNARDLTEVQRGRLVDIIELFLDYQPQGPLAARSADVRKHLDDTWFCWIGGTGDDEVFLLPYPKPSHHSRIRP
ncbi:DUF3500 domain-containing protein [Mycobacterium sp. 1465703.0]|uniref:DUF3500 domain-containing protein n=1 Tax=Mycobacterium sp. 1465703.0 TaxID=1834078 RepID=UPI0018D49523